MPKLKKFELNIRIYASDFYTLHIVIGEIDYATQSFS